MKTIPGDIVGLMARFLIGGVLLYAGFMKAVGPAAEFAAILQAYRLFPPSLLNPLSVGLPYVEMWVGLFLLTGFYTRSAAVAAGVLFTCFLFVLLSAKIRGIDLASCGCFGADALSPRHTIVLDALLLALSALAYKTAKVAPFFSLDRSFP